MTYVISDIDAEANVLQIGIAKTKSNIFHDEKVIITDAIVGLIKNILEYKNELFSKAIYQK